MFVPNVLAIHHDTEMSLKTKNLYLKWVDGQCKTHPHGIVDKVQHFMAIQPKPVCLTAWKPIHPVDTSVKIYQCFIRQNETSSDGKTHVTQHLPCFICRLFAFEWSCSKGFYCCEVWMDSTETASSCSPPSYQQATGGFRPESDQLTSSCGKGKCLVWVNVPLLADYWCVTVLFISYWHNLI